MLIVLIILSIKKLFKQKNNPPNFIFKKFKIVFFLMISLNGFAQSEKYLSVLKNNVEIGHIRLNRIQKEKQTIYEVQSKISAKFIFTFQISGNEKSIFEEGKLTYSYIKRVCNNKTKVMKELKWVGEKYLLTDKDKTSTISIQSIPNNLATLYFNEPDQITQVYCDNYNDMASIVRMNDHSYKVIFPDGNFNLYDYRDRQLERVQVFHSLYKVELVSRPPKPNNSLVSHSLK